MKIAFIVSRFPVLSETFILNQITGLIDLGHEVEIFAKSNPKDKKIHSDVYNYDLIEKVHYFNLPHNKFERIIKALFIIFKNFHKSPLVILNSLNLFKYGKEAFSLNLLYSVVPFLNKKFDIIHCHFGPNGNIGIKLKEIGIPGKYVTSFHGHDANSYPKIKGKNIYNYLFKKGDLFIANTNFTKDQLINIGCDEKKIVILPVGLRVERFKFSTKKIKKNDSIKILTIGRLVEKKGHKYIIEAIAKVIHKNKGIKYIIAGDGPLRYELKELVKNLNLERYVKFLGVVDQDEVLEIYQQSHIFVLPSVTAKNEDREGQALVIQEAQAMGLPVISTLHNGIPEGVINGKSGFLVPEKDINALVEKLEYLIEHPEIWPAMGRCGREFIEKKYNIQDLNNQLVKIYQELYYKDITEP
ncbi:MAG TPA: glycosyltransferase [Bacteroidales bacterium]|nr:glycosyltransferase [Bacteroidales bacterium]